MEEIIGRIRKQLKEQTSEYYRIKQTRESRRPAHYRLFEHFEMDKRTFTSILSELDSDQIDTLIDRLSKSGVITRQEGNSIYFKEDIHHVSYWNT